MLWRMQGQAARHERHGRGKVKLLDLFCGAGGAAMGYYRAGFTDITGVDIKPQKNYPFKFIEADAMTFPLEGYDVIHASPPCQGYSSSMNHHTIKEYPLLIAEVRNRLKSVGCAWVIENVRPLRAIPAEHRLNGVILCGSAFGLRIWRHRWFEASVALMSPPCQHSIRGMNPYRTKSRAISGITGTSDKKWQAAMGIDWMIGSEATLAIPPAYTEFIGKQLLASMAANT